MTRRILFQVHWFLGTTIGLVLAIMGVTGATMSFQDEIMRALSPSIVSVPSTATRLSPDALVAHIQAQRPDASIGLLVLESDSAHAAFVLLRSPQSRGFVYVDPYDGRILGNAVGSGFFAFVERLHRFLALPATAGQKDSVIGRQLTGIAAFCLVFFALSGLYLRWPRRPLDWRAWFVLNLRRTGRNLFRTLHAVIGGWVLVFYLMSALTGLWWSYGWYQRAISTALGIEEQRGGPGAGGERTEGGASRRGGDRRAPGRGDDQAAPGAPAKLPSLDATWASFRQLAGDDFGEAAFFFRDGNAQIEVDRTVRGGIRSGLSDRYFFDPASGNLTRTDVYAKRPLNQIIGGGMFALHSGSVFGIPGRIAMTISSLAIPLFPVTGWLLYLGRRRKRRRDGLSAPVASTERVG